MFCKVCNTRLEPGDNHCPNCGRTASQTPAAAPKKTPLSPSNHDVDLELGEPVEREVEKPRPTTRQRSKRATRPAPELTPTRAPTPSSKPSLQNVREMIAAEPSLLERGLRIKDGPGIRPDGSADTEVGEVDLIGLDSSGSLLVLMIADESKGEELVSEILRRIGWVRRHVGEPDQEVRGIVLTAGEPAHLGYTAAAVADSVSFKTWRLALVVDDIEI